VGSSEPCNCDQAIALQTALKCIKEYVEGAKLSLDNYTDSKDGDPTHLGEAYSDIKRAIGEFEKVELHVFNQVEVVPSYPQISLWEPWK